MGYRFIISHNHTNPENLMLRLTHTHHCSPIQIDLGFRNFEKLWRGGGDCSVCVCVWGGGVPEDMEMKLRFYGLEQSYVGRFSQLIGSWIS